MRISEVKGAPNVIGTLMTSGLVREVVIVEMEGVRTKNLDHQKRMRCPLHQPHLGLGQLKE